MSTPNNPITDRRTLSHGDYFAVDGRVYLFEVKPDLDMGPPWKEDDGHGVISEPELMREHVDVPGELLLFSDGPFCTYYDRVKTLELARRDRWGISEEHARKLTRALGRPPSQTEIYEAAIDEDYDRMRGWARGLWSWVGVRVTLMKYDPDADGGWFRTRHQASLWGIESDSEDYLSTVAYELVDECTPATT